MTAIDFALRTIETAELECEPGATSVQVPYGVLLTIVDALRTCRAVQIACNVCDERTRARLWSSIERELLADAGIEAESLP